MAFLPLALLAPKLHWRRNIGRYITRLWLCLCGIRVQINGLATLPESGCIVVANHCSYIDGPLLAAVLPPRFSLVIKNEAGKVPVVSFFLRHFDHILVERHKAKKAAQDAQRIIDRLQAGDSIGIFAEGTFHATPGVQRFKPSAFIGACRHQIPVVPTAIKGTRHFLPEGRKTIRLVTIEVTLLPSITPASSNELSERQLARQTAEQARHAIANTVQEPLL